MIIAWLFKKTIVNISWSTAVMKAHKADISHYIFALCDLDYSTEISYLSQLMCRGQPARPRHSWPAAAAQTDRFLPQSNGVFQVYSISPWYPFGFRIFPYSFWLPALRETHCQSVGSYHFVCVCVCVWVGCAVIHKLCQLTCSEWASTAEHLQQLCWQELWNCYCCRYSFCLTSVSIILIWVCQRLDFKKTVNIKCCKETL